MQHVSQITTHFFQKIGCSRGSKGRDSGMKTPAHGCMQGLRRWVQGGVTAQSRTTPARRLVAKTAYAPSHEGVQHSSWTIQYGPFGPVPLVDGPIHLLDSPIPLFDSPISLIDDFMPFFDSPHLHRPSMCSDEHGKLCPNLDAQNLKSTRIDRSDHSRHSNLSSKILARSAAFFCKFVSLE